MQMEKASRCGAGFCFAFRAAQLRLGRFVRPNVRNGWEADIHHSQHQPANICFADVRWD